MTTPEPCSRPGDSVSPSGDQTPSPSTANAAGVPSESPIGTGETAPRVPDKSRPRIWTTFVLLFVVFGVIVGAQAVGAVGIMLVSGLFELPADQLQSRMAGILNRPPAFIFLGLLSQIPILAGALIAAHLSPEPFRDRLKLHSPNWSPGKYGLAALATFVPTAIGLSFAYGLQEALPADESVAMLYANMTWMWAVPFLLFISLFPGFGEELLFRGYIQGRLLKRMKPVWAIGITSFLFSLFHITPHAIVFTFPIGLWLGWLAWQTHSVWPGIVCHAFLNFTWNVVKIGTVLLHWSDPITDWLSWGALALGVSAMVVLLRLGLVGKTPDLTQESHPTGV